MCVFLCLTQPHGPSEHFISKFALSSEKKHWIAHNLLHFQFVLPVEGLKADLTMERLLSSVEQLVSLHMVWPRKLFATNVALIAVMLIRGAEKRKKRTFSF